ncbi:MAG: hypothetical protein D6716_15735 [Chloroflexi bacterium]|nr:MAG: hypothetical protein D6716_15735 [Chloroflexota bacterium]
MVSRAEWVALHAHHVRVAQCGVRQPCCRASRAHDPARGIPFPSWSRRCWMCSCRSSRRSGMHATPARRRIVAPGSCLRTSGHGQPLPAVAIMPARRLPACATGSTCSPT